MAVAGDPRNRKGVVVAKNELAKKAGVKTTDTVYQAQRKCPGIVFVPPRHHFYSEISKRVNAIYLEYTDLVEPASIDESYLDVTRALPFYHLSAEGLADELRRRVPDFDLMRELENDAFAELTRPGSKVSLEQAYFALHPELRLREAEAVARRTAEAVSAAVSAGAARPHENGAQAASLGSVSHRDMSKGQRQELRRRIYAAGARGDHLPAGG
jgi:hypothetical protein